MNGKGFFARMFGADADDDETRRLSAEEIGEIEEQGEEQGSGEEWRGREFPVERATRIIDDLPPDVPRESALRIVRGTLKAAGIEVEDIERSIRTRESKLNSDVELARNRQEDLRKRTEEVVRSLEEEIRKARRDRDAVIADEEEKVSRSTRGLEEARRVRVFFGFPETGFPETEGEETADPARDPSDDETRSLEPFDPDETRVIRRPGILDEANEPAEEGPSTREGPGTTDER
jgi:hypothetical protein